MRKLRFDTQHTKNSKKLNKLQFYRHSTHKHKYTTNLSMAPKDKENPQNVFLHATNS